MDKATENLIVAAQQLSEWGLHPMFSRFMIERHAEQIAGGDPVAIARSIFDNAEEEWKGAATKKPGEKAGAGESKDQEEGDGSGSDYDPVAAGKAAAAKQKQERGGGDLAFT